MHNQSPSISFPKAFETRMEKILGGEWSKFIEAHTQTAPVSIRVNPAKTSLPDLPRVLWSDFGFYLQERPVFTLDPVFHAGAYYVQEASSLFLEQALKQTIDLTQPLRVLDLCAAPGGKSTHLLSLLSTDSLLISNEVIRARAQLLWENIQKWGHPNVIVTNSDPSAFQQLKGYFDIIVVDAPCSGEGLFRKDAEACKEWSEENINLCAQRQRRILNEVWPALKENGVLIYSTCTYNANENEANLNALAAEYNVEFVSLKLNPEWNIETISSNNAIGYRFYPHRVQGEGFFISAMIKKESADRLKLKSNSKFNTPATKTIERLKSWTLASEQFRWIQQQDLIIQIPGSLLNEIDFISKTFFPLGKGTAVAELKHDKLIPEHAFALSNFIYTEYFQTTDLNESEAIAYLRKDVLAISEGLKGFGLARYKNQSLGWVNHLGNRTNNLYPANWRIRMSAGINPSPE
ncbi:MAG TPA: rRNA methyltransferase [Cyclobacteriaceae bacterium]|nr:rRNA methyltransferase [Cyclobacteriaceae bacterium]